MKKQTILITGGAQRIGKAIALSLKNNNLNFIIHYNNSIKEAKDLANIGVAAYRAAFATE